MKKGEIIIVTQKEDGGWWEGTSRETGKTGWFPSNYVSEIKDVTPTSDSGMDFFITGFLGIFFISNLPNLISIFKNNHPLFLRHFS